MQEKAAHELVGRQRHEFAFVVVLIIPPAEGDRSVVEGHQAMIGDRHAMRIAAQIVQDLLWSAKGRLGIHHPLRSPQGSEVSGKAIGIGQGGKGREELEAPLRKGFLEQG
jgi:hypothetical protein